MDRIIIILAASSLMRYHRIFPANIHITPVIIPFEINGYKTVKYRLSLYLSLRSSLALSDPTAANIVALMMA